MPKHAELNNYKLLPGMPTQEASEIALSLIAWLEQNFNIHHKALLTEESLSRFFDTEFLINANHKEITASPLSFAEHLVELSNTINKVNYELIDVFEKDRVVILNLDTKIIDTNNHTYKSIQVWFIHFTNSGKIKLWTKVSADL